LADARSCSPQEERAFGNSVRFKNSDQLRIGQFNPCGLPHSNDARKNGDFRALVRKAKLDVVCLNEINTAWHKVPADQRLHDRFQDSFGECVVVSAWYKDYPELLTPRQAGGCALVVMGNTRGRVVSTGHDPTGLGRWCWARLTGQDGGFIRVISAYRPVRGTGDNSVFNQQALYFEKERGDMHTDPQKAFTTELMDEISRFKDMGDEISLCLDLNADVRDQDSFFGTETSRLFLREVITEQHGIHGPETRQGGSKPIDGIYLSELLSISKSGYLDYCERVGDHRMLWADIPLKIAFGVKKYESNKINARRLKNKDPRVVKRYVTKYYAYLIQHDLFARASKLEQAIKEGQPLTAAQIAEFEDIDELRVKGMKLADRKCRKLHMGAYEYSPALDKALDTKRYWLLVSERKQGKRRIGLRRLIRLAKKADLQVDHSLSLEEVLENVEKARVAYNATKKQHKTLRGKHVDALATAQAENGKENISTIIRVMRQRELARKGNRVIKKVTKPNARGALIMVHSDNAEGEIETHTSKEDIENAGMTENERRFRQANGTPLQQPIAIETYGRTGNSVEVEELLRTGKVPQEIIDLDPFLEDYLAAHKIGETQALSHELSTAAHQQGWSKVKEATSSGRSNLHFGHFIAGSSHAQIAAFEACLSGIPWLTGYSPKRWRQGINVMIEKKQGQFHVSTLRTILLLEADFNQGNKRIGRQIMYNAEVNNRLAAEQYGSRKFYTAINQGLNKRLTFDVWRQLKQRGALCSTDAMSCYDRIVHLAAALAMRRAGASPSAVHCMLDTLQGMKHYIRTAFGDSVTYFDADDHSGIPIGGSGQGNGASPPIWALVSTPIFDALRGRGYGVFVKLGITGDKMHFVGYAFVDDTDLAVNDVDIMYDAERTDIFDLIQDSVTLWEGFIRASGGAIRPDKSHWYLVDFQWDANGDWSYVEENPAVDKALVVRNHVGVYEEIERVAPDDARRTVGVRLGPDGSNLVELKYLKEQAAEWEDRIKSSRMPKALVWQSFTMGLQKKLFYPLAATTFTREECDEIMKPVLNTALSHSGYNCHIARALVYGPLELLGIGCQDMYIEQGISHIQRFVDKPQLSEDITGFLLQTSMEQLKLELGVSKEPFDSQYGDLRHLATECYVTHMWDFLQKYDIRIKTSTGNIDLQRQGDSMFMEHLLARTKLRKGDMQSVQKCRLFLKVARISDVISVCGKFLRKEIYEGSECCRKNVKELGWPRQGQPSARDWQKWRETLLSMFGVLLPSMRIATALGRWIIPWTEWEWFTNSDQSLVNRVNHEQGDVHVFIRTEDRGYVFQASEVVSLGAFILGNAFQQIDVSESGDQVSLVSLHSTPMHWEFDFQWRIPEISLFNYNCNRFRQETQWAFQFTYSTMDDDKILGFITGLQNEGIAAVSDGSSKDGFGSAAWICTFFDGVLSAGFKVPGEPEDQDSYRSEMAGLHAILSVIRAATRIFHLQTVRAHIACDGESALKRSFYNSRPSGFRDSHWDLLTLLQQQIKGMPQLLLEWHHVAGHQDDVVDADLDIWARWNIKMDLRAKECRVFPGAPITFPGTDQLWSVEIEGKKLVQNTVESIRYHCTSENAKDYWFNTGRIGSALPEDVTWSSAGAAMKEISLERRKFVTKHSSGWCAVNKNTIRWNMDVDDSCPRCGQQSETAAHVWRCTAPSAQLVWKEHLEKLEKWMTRKKTCPAIKEVIISRLRSWKSGSKPAPVRSTYRGLKEVVLIQDRLGWNSAFEGRWSNNWIEVQKSYLKFIESKKGAKRWMIELIKKLWLTAWDLWQDRNKDNAKRKTKRLHGELHTKVEVEYEIGFALLHPKHQDLFTRFTVEKRLTFTDQTNVSWLLRVESARTFAETEPFSEEDLARAREKVRKQQATAQQRIFVARKKRTELQMRTLFAVWLQRKDQTEEH
jgi:hypothetical protein